MLDNKKDLNDFTELNQEQLQSIAGGKAPQWLINFRDWNIKHAQDLNNIAGAVGSFYSYHDYYNK
jgi:bacteriocin-like protein